jgi:hypothetical protein
MRNPPPVIASDEAISSWSVGDCFVAKGGLLAMTGFVFVAKGGLLAMTGFVWSLSPKGGLLAMTGARVLRRIWRR